MILCRHSAIPRTLRREIAAPNVRLGRHTRPVTPGQHAYTLIETLVAAGILLLVLAAAASLSGSLGTQELLAQRTALALNYQEQAARLWHMGITPSAINESLLIRPPEVTSLTFTESTTNLPGIGTMRRAECRMVFSIEGVPDARTNELLLLRPEP